MGRYLHFGTATLLALLSFHDGIRVVDALPGGAAGCPSGEAAVNGPHLSADTVVTGPLQAGDLVLTINDEDVPPPNNNINLQLGFDFFIGVRRRSGTFKGALIRMEDTAAAPIGTLILEPLEGDTVMQDASACISEAPAIGITHSTASAKTAVRGYTRFDVDAGSAEQDVRTTLDVTVVIELQGGRSEYYHTSYLLNFLRELPTGPPVDMPVGIPRPVSEPPTPAPVPPTAAPVPPTAAPVPRPTPAPVPAPTTAAPTPTTPPVPVELPSASAQQCLYDACDTEADCCSVAPVCRLRVVSGVSQRICSARPRANKTKLCDTCAGAAGRPKTRGAGDLRKLKRRHVSG